MDLAHLQTGDLIADRFEITRRMRGEDSPLFAVVDREGGEAATLLVLPADLPASGERDRGGEAAVQRGIAAGKLGHPSIAAVRDTGLLPTGETYLLLEPLTGSTLRDHVKGRVVPAAEIAELCGQIGAALGAAHAAGIEHRALRPEAVIVGSGRPLVVKLIDFSPPPRSKEEQTPERAHYQSPEQFRGEEGVDARTDVYSLGVVLYEIAAGRRPFDSKTLHDLLLAVAQDPPEPLLKLRPDLGAGFAMAVHRALSPDPELRQRGVLELSEEASRGLDPGEDALSSIVAGNDKIVDENKRTPPPEPAVRTGISVPLVVTITVALVASLLVAQWAFAPRRRPMPGQPSGALEEARAAASAVRSAAALSAGKTGPSAPPPASAAPIDR